MEVEFLKERIISMMERLTYEQIEFVYRFLIRVV